MRENKEIIKPLFYSLFIPISSKLDLMFAKPVGSNQSETRTQNEAADNLHPFPSLEGVDCHSLSSCSRSAEFKYIIASGRGEPALRGSEFTHLAQAPNSDRQEWESQCCHFLPVLGVSRWNFMGKGTAGPRCSWRMRWQVLSPPCGKS